MLVVFSYVARTFITDWNKTYQVLKTDIAVSLWPDQSEWMNSIQAQSKSEGHLYVIYNSKHMYPTQSKS